MNKDSVFIGLNFGIKTYIKLIQNDLEVKTNIS